MSNVKTNLSKLNMAQQVALARRVVSMMTGNANFTTPVPALNALTTAADDLEAAMNAAEAARAASRLATTTQMAMQAVLLPLLAREASYVQTTAAGDAEKIESSGFEVRNTPAPIGPLPAPSDVELDANVNPGHMGVKWTHVKGAASYVIQRALEAESLNYVAVANPTSAKAVVNSMTSGTRYWFRIAAIGAAGTGLWTLPVSKIAP